MTVSTSSLNVSGSVAAKKIKGTVQAPLSWKLQNLLVNGGGFLKAWAAKQFSLLTGIPTIIGSVRAVKIDGITGQRVDYGVVSNKVVTTAWVNFLVDNMVAETTEFGDLKFHDSGVGVTAPAVGDTDMETTDGEARVTGTQLEGASANIYKTVGTITYTTTKAITEHGVFTQVTGGTLCDRSTFTAINVVNTDQIEFTYELTVSAGG